MIYFSGRSRRLALIGTSGVAIALGAGAVAWAVIPDLGTSLIHGCYNTSSGALRVIDPSKGQSCAVGEAALNWNAHGLNWRSGWNPTVSYAANDVVTRNGSTYVARASNVNSAPPSTNWLLLAGKPYANVFSESNATNPSTYPVIISSNLTQVAQTTPLPAGNFVVNAQAVVFMDNGAQDVICDLEDNHGNVATATAETSGPPDSSSTGVVQTLTITDAFANEPSGTKMLLECAKADGADLASSSVSSAAIVVNQVGNLAYNGTTFPQQ